MRLAWIIILFIVLGCPYAWAGEIHGIKAKASDWKIWGAPSAMVDGDTATAWVGGSQGFGPGKKLTFTLPKAQTISRIRIANGNQGPSAFNAFRCITAGVLLLPDNAAHFFKLNAQAREQDIVFLPATVASFEIIITEVSKPRMTPPQGRDKVAVSEVRVFNDSNHLSPNVLSSPTKSATTVTSTVKATPKGQMHMFAATRPGALWLKAAVPTKDGTPVEQGTLHPFTDPWMIDLISSYFNNLTTLSDNYINVFAPSLREREQHAFILLQETMRKSGRFADLRKTTPDGSGLSLAKPIVRGDAAMVRVHGTYRYTTGTRTFEFPVDAHFSFTHEKGGWFINGVKSK